MRVETDATARDGRRAPGTATGTPGRRDYHTVVVSPFMPEAEKVAAVRNLLPATGAGIFLNAGTAGPMPAETQRAMDEQAVRELATGRAYPDFWPETIERMAEARAAVAAVMVADPADIALTHSATDGLNLAVSALRWRPGDRVLTTRHEHPGGLGPLQALHARLGVEVEQVDIGDGGDDERTLEAFGRALERPVRAILASHVLWTTGAVLPVARLATLARDAGALTIIDGAQAAGAIRFVLDELDVDAYALPAQKWLLGPEGMGALWVRRALADATVPQSAGGLSYEAFDGVTGGTLHPGARRFEATGFHRPSIVGFARSCGWLSMVIGLPWAQARAARLAAAAADRLSSIPGVTLVTPRARMATLVTFRIAGWPSVPAVEELGARAFAILRGLPPIDAIRISVGFWNTDEELDRFADAVELLARHTLETIPPRRRLTVLGSDDLPLR
jgi:L-cysteine/cystine lyase